jgi:uncharacterized protein YjbI with pentapeptide repeats
MPTTQQSISLQAGLSVQRVMYNAPCPCPTVQETKYTDQDLTRRAFVNLTMSNVEFLRCIMKRTNFTKTTLALFSMKQSDGTCATFSQVSLSDGCLASCNFSDAVWIGAWLQHIRLATVNLTHGLFSNSNLNFVSFNDCEMKRCVFDNATMRNTRFCNMACHDDMRDRLSFKSATMDTCTFQSSNLNNVVASQTDFNNCKMVDCQFTAGNFENTTLVECLLQRCVIKDGDFSLSNLNQCVFEGVDCDGVDFSSARLNAIEADAETNLANIYWDHATLSNNSWPNHDFGEATFQNATMNECNFDHSKMIEVNFSKAVAENVQFNHALLSTYGFTGTWNPPTNVYEGPGCCCGATGATGAFVGSIEEDHYGITGHFQTNFSETTLNKVSMEDAHCGQLSFSKSKWNRCSLKNTYFSRGDFTETVIADSVLDGCKLSYANFSNANLTRCSLNHANLKKANFFAASLTEIAVDENTHFTDVVFSEARLTGNAWTRVQDFGQSRFNNASISQCQFDDSDMAYVIFIQADVVDTSLRGTILGQDADLFSDFSEATLDTVETDENTVFDFCHFNQANLLHMTVDRSSMEHVECNEAKLDTVKFLEVNMSHAKFNKSKWSECLLQGCTADYTDFTDADLTDTLLEGCDASESLFCNATLTRCSLNNSNLQNADFSDATLHYIAADPDTYLTNATFSGANLQSNDWIGIRHFGKSRFDGATVLKCKFDECHMAQVNFITTGFTETSFLGTVFGKDDQTHSYFTEATLDEVKMDGNTVLDYCQFDKSGLRNLTLPQVSMISCNFNSASVVQVLFEGVDATDATFHHVKMSDSTIDADSFFDGVSFIDSEMDNVGFMGTNLDNNVVFDNSKLFNMKYIGASLISTSFVGSTLSDADFTDAVLSADTNEKAGDDALVAAKFEQATLTRAVFQGRNAYLRFTIFSQSTLAMCTFTGTSGYDMLNMIEANLNDATITDTTFTHCDLAYATMANTILSRCHFYGCSMSNLNVENAQVEYCTVDEFTILPPYWARDSNGWIVLLDPGPRPDVEERHKIKTVGVYGDYFRITQTKGQMLDDGTFIVTWIDGTDSAVTRLHRMNLQQPDGGYNVDDAVFVCFMYEEEFGDNFYMHGKVVQKHVNGTYDIEYYKTSADIPFQTVDTNQEGANIFPEYFARGEERTVSNFENRVYRLVEQVNGDNTVTWYDGQTEDAFNPVQISLKQPLILSYGDPVFVLISSNNNAEDDNYYLPGYVSVDNEDDTYEINYVQNADLPDGGGSTSTTQHIEFLYHRIVDPETDPLAEPEEDPPVVEPPGNGIMTVTRVLDSNDQSIFQYRSVKTLGAPSPNNTGNNGSSWNATFFNNTTATIYNYRKFKSVQPEFYEQGEQVFVLILEKPNGDNVYALGTIDTQYLDNTYDIFYVSDIIHGIEERKIHVSKIYREYFEFGKVVNIGLCNASYYRTIKNIEQTFPDKSLKVKWFDDTISIARNPIQLNLIQPLFLNIGDVVFVLIKSNSGGKVGDNHYLLGSVIAKKPYSVYKIAFADPNAALNPEGFGQVPTDQFIKQLYLPKPN